MKITISVPDEVFQEAERLTQRLGKSRSQLYTDALVEYLARYDPDTVTERLDRVLESLTEPEDRFVRETSRTILKRVDW